MPAPFVDFTLTDPKTGKNLGLEQLPQAIAAGTKFFNLGFVTAQVYPKPGDQFDTVLRTFIDEVRAAGGDVAISFGGESNSELADFVQSDAAIAPANKLSTLVGLYSAIIDQYKLTHVDFDIEGGALTDRPAMALRSKAIAALEAKYPGLQVSFTLPITPDGLDAFAMPVVQSAIANNVNIALINGMAMNFGPWWDQKFGNDMAAMIISAGDNLFVQLKKLYADKTDAQLWHMVGITVRIGLNYAAPGAVPPLPPETVTGPTTAKLLGVPDVAQLTLGWAESKGIGLLSMWSLGRDQARTDYGRNPEDALSSDIPQANLEFSTLFDQLDK